MERGCLGSDPDTSRGATNSCTLHPDFSICTTGMVQNLLQGVTEHFTNERTCHSKLPGTEEEWSWLTVHWMENPRLSHLPKAQTDIRGGGGSGFEPRLKDFNTLLPCHGDLP